MRTTARAELRWVVLAPEARGTGLGKRMITEAVSEARRLGFERLELDTFGALTTAAAIYRSVGFQLVSEEADGHVGAADRLPALRAGPARYLSPSSSLI